MPLDALDIAFEQEMTLIKSRQGESSVNIARAKALVDQGWRKTYAELFGQSFVDVLANHHSESIEWHWNARIDLLEGRKPEYYADFPKFSRGHMKCVHGDTEILMSDGTRRAIKDIRPGDVVQSYLSPAGRIVANPVTGQWFAGQKKCVKLHTRSGREITATPDHRVLTFDGYKKIGDLLPDDRIASPRKTLVAANDYPVSDEEIRLLTYFLAEGNTTYGGTSFAANITNADDVIVDDVISCAESLGFVARKSDRAKFRILVSCGVRPWLTKNGLEGKKATEKRVPDWFFHLSARQIEVALAAFLDTDGFISKQAAGINLANEKLIDDLRCLCLQIGIVTKKYYLPRKGFGSWVLEFDHHNIQRLSNLPLKLKKANWQMICSVKRYSLIDCYPRRIANYLSKEEKKQLNKSFKWKISGPYLRITRDKIQKALQHIEVAWWRGLEQADVFWDEIVSITDAGTFDTYDIEVEGTHNFIANGLVTHNSTLVRRIAVVDALLSYAYGVGGYCLYFSGTDDKTSKHAVSISQLLQSKPIQHYAPGLAKVKRAEEGNRSLGWKATFFYTSAGYVYHFGSLQSGLAGGNVDDLRPTLLIPDDIDDRKDSIAEAEKNTKAFTKEILPMGKTGTLTYFAQNLISRFSVMYRIHKNKLKVLTNRRPSEPVPAVEGFEIEYRTVNGISKPFIIAGRATWEKGMPLSACEEELQRIGEESFRSECLHEVEQARTGLVHKNYEDAVHAISFSQFAAVYGSPDAWKNWFKAPLSDWARTKTKFHANVAGYLAVSSQNTRLPGLTFLLPYSFKADTSPEDVAIRLLSALTPYAYDKTTWEQLVDEAWKRANEQQHFQTVSDRLEYLKAYYKNIIPHYSRPVLLKYNVGIGANSHSEDKVREMFNQGFGFRFIAANPTKTEALEDIDDAMRVDFDLPHLFDNSKMGYSRWYVLCPDDTSQEPIVVDGIAVYPPLPFPDSLEGDELHDSDLFRYQMCNRRFAEPKLTELGESIDVMLKLHDDFGQILQFGYLKRLLSNIPLSPDEEFAETLHRNKPHLTPEAIESAPEENRPSRYMMREVERKEFEQKKKGQSVEKTDFYVSADDDFSWMNNL